jgi:hypothetical protein
MPEAGTAPCASERGIDMDDCTLLHVRSTFMKPRHQAPHKSPQADWHDRGAHHINFDGGMADQPA